MRSHSHCRIIVSLALLALLNFIPQLALAHGTAFTYDGLLQKGGLAQTGNFNFTFTLYDAASGGSAIATPITLPGVAVKNGAFTVTLDFGGLTVCKTGPWGQGPVFLQQLAMLAGFDPASMAPASAEFVHTVTEVAKLAFADREAWYGDPRQSDVPLADLLSAGYAAERRELACSEASGDLRPG